METATLLSLLEDLEENIDDLEDSLEPLLEAALSVTTKKLPLLDRAKLYTLIVYSIESLLFCTVQYIITAPSTDKRYSLPATQRSPSEGTCGLQRVITREAIFREDQASRRWSCEATHESQQTGNRQIHQARFGRQRSIRHRASRA